MTWQIILPAALAILIIWAILIYNNLVRNKNLVAEGWSGIEIQLKRRANLIHKLVDTVKGYMAYENDVIQSVVESRARCLGPKTPKDRGAEESRLSGALTRLFALAEDYPNLKASQNFIQLQTSISEVEDQIQLARRYYNGATRDLNVLIESIPSNLVARQFQFQQADYFELEEPGDRAVPEIHLKDGPQS